MIVTGPLEVGPAGITPPPPVLLVVAVEKDITITVHPIDTVSRFGAAVVELAGGIMPAPSVELAVMVDPDMVTVSAPERRKVLVALVGMIPPPPVELAVSVDREIVTTSAPELIKVLLALPGGMMPPPPIELTVRMESDVPRVVVVVDVVTSIPGALGEGGMTPPSPVETYVDVALDTMISIELWVTVTFALSMGVPLGTGKLGVATAPVKGRIIPLSLVDVCVTAEKMS